MQNKKKYKLLIVDDEVDLCKFVQLCLDEDLFQVEYTHSGQDAFKILSHQNYDLVLSDIKMKRGDGIELLTNIRTLPAPPCVVIMTAYSEVSKEEILKTGAKAILVKPFDLDELEEALEKCFTN